MRRNLNYYSGSRTNEHLLNPSSCVCLCGCVCVCVCVLVCLLRPTCFEPAHRLAPPLSFLPSFPIRLSINQPSFLFSHSSSSSYPPYPISIVPYHGGSRTNKSRTCTIVFFLSLSFHHGYKTFTSHSPPTHRFHVIGSVSFFRSIPPHPFNSLPRL